ncbi:MAG: ADP-ribosyltransferase [Clostridiales bacterium]|nr:ADP-ribosyltransferase [Clostridiales bacterium]
MLKPKTVNNWKSLLAETAKQAGVEASEEMFTEVANILSDAAIMGDSSDFSTAVAGYIAQGMSEEKAKQMAFLDCISRVVWAGAGGALSGGLMGGTVGAWNHAGGQLGGRSTANTQETLAAQDGANVQSGTVDTPAPQQAQKTASTGETGYNRIEADSIRHEGKTFRNLVAGIDSSVSAFFEKWRNGRKGRPDEKLEKLYLGRMSEGTRAAVSDILGYEVSERDFIVTNDGVKHILDTHGDPEAEVRKGNLPLTSDIIDALPSVVKNPDNIRPGHAEKSSPYRQGVIFEKMLPDGTVVYIQFDNSKRGTFEGRTLYVKEKESSPSGVDASMETPTSTSKTTEPELSSAPIIADSSAGGNTQSAQAGPESSVGAATTGVTGDEVGESGFHAPSAFRDADLTSAFGENGAKAYRLGWRGDMDEADYYRAFTHAYNAGAAGRSLDSLKDRTLTDAQRGAAFESGRSDADAAARKAGFTTVYGKDSGLVWDDYTRSMDQKVAGQVNEVAKRLGVKVQFADRVAGGAANAKIENGVITIARDAKNPVRAVFGHEITHRIQELAPEEYRAFREAAMAHYENAEDGMVDALVWDQQSRYTKVDQDLSNLDAMDEIAADYAGSLMEDGALLDRFIQANQGKRTLLWKLRDVFRSLADRLTGKYKDQARQAERRLEQALKAAARQAASLQGKAHGATMSETKLSLKNMNEDETAALLQYKSSDSYKVNAKLRDGQRLTEAEQKMVDDLDRALEKLPVHEGTVYRRLSFDMEGQEALDAFLAEHAEGDIVPYEAYTSGSTTQDGYPVQGELTVTQIISSQTGRDMAGIGNNFESEVVFSRNTRFYVEKVEVDVNGKTVIYMEEVVKHGIGQLYSEERVQTVQQMQASAGKDSKLQKVSGVDSGRGADRRGLPGVRGEGNEEVKFSLKGSDQLTREIDRLMKQAQDGTRSEAEVRREIRGLVDEVYQGMVEQYGSIKPGEKPAREVRVPRRTADDRKVSQTVRTILEAKATPDTAVPNIEELTATGAFSYETYTDKAAIADAESTIRDKGYATALAEWSESVGKGEVSKANTATGWALYNAAANAGDLKSAMTVLTKMVGHQRNAAQAVQATRILKSMSPEGQLYGVQRSVGNLQEELKKKYGKNAPDLKIDPNLAENLLKAENQEARDEAAKELFRDIGRQMPSRFMDKWNAWRYLAMLGNSRTHVRNFVGNAFFAPVVAAKSLTATSIEAAVSRVSHGKLERTKGAVGLGKADRALLSSAWADYANVQDSALGGGKYSDFANANQYIEEGRRIFKNKALETFRKGNTKALDAEDVWFSRPHYAYALAQYCKANHITAEQIAAGKGMDKARAYAIKEAQKATYRDTNALSQAISDLGRYRGKGPVGKGISTVMEGVLPFRKTPANILARGLEYSPAGLLKGLTYDLYQVREGNLSGAEAIDHISAGMTGTGLLAFGAYCAAQCLVRGAGGDDKDRKAFAELQGHQNYALELPDGTSITLDWLAPEVLPFFIGVNLWEMTQGEKEPLTLSAILRASANVTEPLLEMSCLQSLNDVFDAVGYASSGDLNGLTAALVTAATSYLTQGVPTVLGQFERTGQEERMTTYTEKNAFLTPDAQYTLGRISGRIPGWDYNQIPHIDAWGRTENTGGAGKRAFDNFANPAYTSEVKSSPMEDELLRLYETTGEKGVFPARAGKYFTVNGERKDLTAEEYVTYATKRGQLSHTLVTELTGSKSYQSMTDEQLVYLIVNARQK